MCNGPGVARLVATVASLLVVCLPGRAAAQGAPQGAEAREPGAAPAGGPEGPAGGPPTDTTWSIEAAGDVTDHVRLSDRARGARLAAVRGRLSAGVELSPARWIRLSLECGGERAAHDWRRPERLGSPEVSIGEEPWDEVQTLSASFGAQVFLGPRWSLVARASVSTGVEPGADLEDGASGSLSLSGGYRFGAELTVGLGLLAIARLEDSPLVVPALFFRWSPVPGVLVETAGPGLRATFDLLPELATTLRAAFELRQWRLEERRRALSSGVVQDTRVATAVGLVWRPAAGLALRLEVGATPYVELELRDRRGRDVRRLQGEPAGFITLGLEVTL